MMGLGIVSHKCSQDYAKACLLCQKYGYRLGTCSCFVDVHFEFYQNHGQPIQSFKCIYKATKSSIPILYSGYQ